MATLPISESRRRYSWWWDSHISPKNSRWLQDNLTDMDMKVKAMIKLIEEDADSFARRAEMYYKKRPELMKLVEEFYRAYRALAERYDQATGALRQAHRTMTEAFPNQIALMSPDDSPYASSNNSIEPHTPEVPPPVRAFFCSEDLPKDTSGLSSDFHALSRNGTYSEDNNSLPSKRGLKQLNEMFGSGEARVKKGLNFLEEDGELDNKERKGYREPQKVREKHDINVIKDLQQDVSRLSTENQNLKTQAMEESDRANKAVSEIQSLKDRLSELNSQKDADLLQYQKSLERVSILESQLSNAQSDMQKLKSDVLIEAQKVSNIEEHNRSLYLELEKLEKKAKMQEHELKLKQDEFSEVTIALQEKERQCTESQLALLAKEKQLIESEEEVKLLNLEIQKGMEKLRDIQLSKRNLQEKICKLKEENDNLKEENINSNLSIKDLQAEIILLKDKHKKLTEEIEFHIGEKEILDQEFCHLKEGRSELERKHQEIVKKMEIIVLNSESLHATIMGLQTENFELKENCKTWEPEKNLLMEKLEHMGEISERNKTLEYSISELNIELGVQKEKNLALNGSLESLNHELSTCISERDSLVSQYETLIQDLKFLSDKNSFLGNALSEAKLEIHALEGKAKDFEKSCQSLEDQSCIQRETISALKHSNDSLKLELSICISEKDSLVSQLGNLTNDVENLSEKNNVLDNALFHANSQVDQLKAKLANCEASCQYFKEQNAVQTDKIAALNASHEFLNLELSTRICERDSLTSQLESLTQERENLSVKSKLLDIALSKANVEGQELKTKLKDLEESCQSLKDSNDSLNLELSARITERDSVISQLEILTQNMENLSGKNNLLENMLSDAKSEVTELNRKLKDLEESYQSLKDQNCTQREEIASLNVSYESLNLELSTCIAERDAFVSQLEILTQSVGNLSEKNNFLENALSDANSEVRELKEKVKDLEESCQSLKDQNCIQSEKIAALNDSNDSLNLELSTRNIERDSVISQLQIFTVNMENLLGKNNVLENALSDAKSKVAELNEKLKDLEESCQTLKDQNCTQSEKIASLNISHESLNVELSTCIAERDGFISQLEILTQSLGNFSEKNDLLENALSDARSEVGELKSKVKNLEESCQTLNDRNCIQSEKIVSLNISHDSLNAELSTCTAERDAFISHLEILTQRLGNFSEKNDLLENALSDAKSEVGELKAKVENLEESCQTLNYQNSTQSEKIASLNDSHESLNLELSTCIAERDSFVSQLEILTKNVGHLSENKNFLEKALSIAKSEVGELKEKVKDLEESCRSLKDQNCTQSEKIASLNDSYEPLNLELSNCIAERDTVVSQLDTLTQSVEDLSEKNSLLENAKSELEELKVKLKDSEESCHILKYQNFTQNDNILALNDLQESLNLELSARIAERDSLLSQLEILTQSMENLSEKNNILDNAFSGAKSEVLELKEKLKNLEESCQSFKDQNFNLREKNAVLNDSCESLNLELSNINAERDSIVSQLEILTLNVNNLSEKNNFLENALSYSKIEVDGLKAKLEESEKSFQSLEEYCQSLKDENINLLAENNALTSQVQSITSSLDNLGNMLAELRDKHSILSRERDLSINQINELEILLELEKEEHTNVIQSYKAQITNFGNVISLLQEENNMKHKELEEEQNRSIASMVEIFILQTTLSEAHERNFILSQKAKKHLEGCRKAEELVSKLEQEKSIQTSKLLSLTKHNEKLIHGIRLFSNTLLTNKGLQLIDDIQVDSLLDIILIEVGKLLNVISDNEFENQQLHLEVSILATLLRHAALDVVNLRSERCHLEQELKVRAEESLSFENKHAELLDLNAQLMKKCEHNIQMEQVMKAEIEALSSQLRNLQEALQTSTVERLELIEEKTTLSIEVCNLKQKHLEFEKEHAEILQEAMKQCHHHLFFKSLSSERLAELKSSSSLNEQLMDNIEASKQREELLKAELGIFSTQLNALHKALRESEYQILKIIEEKETLSDELCKLKRKHSDSEVRNIEILAEAMRLEHLYLYFKNLSAERLTELKSYYGFHEHLMQNIESKKQREKLLSAELGVLSAQLNRLQESFQASQAENLMLLQERDVLSEELHNLKKKYYDLEEEHNDALAETIKLNHLHLYFKSLSLETLLMLKSTDCDITSLRYIKSNLDAEIVKLNGEIGMVKLENTQLMDSVTYLEELRKSLLTLEFDLNNARNFYDELYLQSESLRNELIQKERQLLEANEKVKTTDEKNVELLRTLQDVQLQIEESKLVKEELEMKNIRLTEAVSQSNKEIRWLQEGSAIMQKEIDKINEEVEVLTTRETDLLTELQKQTNEVECCELEINALLSEIQILTVNAAIYEEKAHELTLEGEISYMVEKLMLTMEVTFIKDHIDVAKKMINDLEEQIKELVAETTSLHIVEVTSDLKALNGNERKDISLEPHQQHSNDSQPRAGHKSMSIAVSELEQFIAKANALQKMIIDVRAILKQERFDCNSSLMAARKEAKEVWLQTLDGQTDIQESKNFSMKLDENGVTNDISKEKIGQMMKDIQLDQASSSSHYMDDGSNRQHISGNSEIDDQLWEAAERECHNQSQKVSEVDPEHDIETVEEEKSEYPSSELLPEKELNIDMLGTLKKHLLSKQEWNKKIVERLKSDAVRLSDIKTSVEELERKMEGSSMGKLPPNVGYDTIKAQLKEAEANVLELMDVNSNLTKNVASSHGSDTKHGEKSSTRRRQISEDARKTSEKVGQLELELQKIQYILLKLEEEHENKRSKAVHRRSRVLLRDFLYGRKENGRLTKKSCFCGCMRPKTNDEH